MLKEINVQSSDCSQFGVYQISLAATPNQYFIAPDNYVPDSTYSFDVSIACSINDCPTITATIPSSIMEYGVYPLNSPTAYTLGPSLSVNNCLVPDFDIVNDDGSAIDNSAFSYDKSMNVFKINTQNTQLAGEYPMKLVNDGMTQSEFSVILNDYCETPTVTSTEQVNPDDYHFSGAVTFELNKFQVTPVECFIVYTCLMVEGPVEYDLCNFTDEKTTSSFNPDSGVYYFKSDNYMTYKNTTLVFEITGTSR